MEGEPERPKTSESSGWWFLLIFAVPVALAGVWRASIGDVIVGYASVLSAGGLVFVAGAALASRYWSTGREPRVKWFRRWIRG